MLDKIGIPKSLSWGFLGIMFFMLGDGLEAGWMSPFLVENGLTVQQSALIFTVYGISITIASWCLLRNLWPEKIDVNGVIILYYWNGSVYHIWF